MSARERRASALTVVRQLLQVAGEERRVGGRAFLPGVLRLAKGVRLSVTEIGALAGLSRPSVYSFIGSERPSGFDPELEAIACLAYLGAQGVSNVEPLSTVLHLPPPHVLALLERLSGQALVNRALVSSGEAAGEAIFILDDRGHQLLTDEARRLAHYHAPAYTFYFEVSEDEAKQVQNAAQQLLGYEDHVMIDAYVSSAMRSPELAVLLRADDARSAFTIAREVWGDVLRKAALPQRAPSIALFLPPTPPSETY